MTKELPLTKGKVAIIDAKDFKYLSQWKWCLSHYGYAVRHNRGKKTIVYMHIDLAKPPRGMFVDHVNGDRTDNRRSNLRVCTKSQNLMNRGKTRKNTSGFKGVYWGSAVKKWIASIRVGGKATYLGVFTDKIEAAKAYDAAARKMHGEFACTNF